MNSLILMPWPANVGYAIGRLERIFFDVTLRMAQGDPGRVCFAYPDCPSGLPDWRPPGYDNVEVLDVKDRSRANLGRIGDLARRRSVDFALTFDLQPVHPAYRALRYAGVSAIVSYWGAPISSIDTRWKLLLKRLLLAASRSRADGLVFESRAMAELAIHGRGVPHSMIDIVPLGVDPDAYRPAHSDYAHRIFGIPRERRIVVYSGHCTERKGVHVLVDAAVDLLEHRKRRDVCFLICGNQGDESRPFEARYRGLEVARWIQFVGYRSDLPQIFQSAYCGAIASVGWDSYTLSSVEMAASGLPIVASRLQGLAESIIDGKTGLLFEPGNAVDLADRLSELLDDAGRAAALGRTARHRVERELTTDAQRERLLRVFSRHLDRRMRRHASPP